MEIRIPFNGWRIVREIGHGSYGRVYEIERDFLGDRQRAAMKVISIPTDENTLDYLYSSNFDETSIRTWCRARLDDIRREYSLMMKMKGNTNIVSCEDVEVLEKMGSIGYEVYIRMELLTSLQKVLRERQFTETDVIKLGMDICKALVICDKLGIIHRDIKPENILVSDYGDYKLGDFGIARTLEHTTNASVAGTERYMAPEIIRGQAYGRDVDTYSLGLVMYWLLNRRTMPFMTIGELPSMHQVSAAQGQRLSGAPMPLPVDGSAELKRIVLKACSYRREDRYTSAAAMLKDLENLKFAQANPQSIPQPLYYQAKPDLQAQAVYPAQGQARPQNAQGDYNYSIPLEEETAEFTEDYFERTVAMPHAMSGKYANPGMAVFEENNVQAAGNGQYGQYGQTGQINQNGQYGQNGPLFQMADADLQSAGFSGGYPDGVILEPETDVLPAGVAKSGRSTLKWISAGLFAAVAIYNVVMGAIQFEYMINCYACYLVAISAIIFAIGILRDDRRFLIIGFSTFLFKLLMCDLSDLMSQRGLSFTIVCCVIIVLQSVIGGIYIWNLSHRNTGRVKIMLAAEIVLPCITAILYLTGTGSSLSTLLPVVLFLILMIFIPVLDYKNELSRFSNERLIGRGLDGGKFANVCGALFIAGGSVTLIYFAINYLTGQIQFNKYTLAQLVSVAGPIIIGLGVLIGKEVLLKAGAAVFTANYVYKMIFYVLQIIQVAKLNGFYDVYEIALVTLIECSLIFTASLLLSMKLFGFNFRNTKAIIMLSDTFFGLFLFEFIASIRQIVYRLQDHVDFMHGMYILIALYYLLMFLGFMMLNDYITEQSEQK